MMQTSNASEPVVRIRGLTKRFGAFTAVDQLDLDVMPGEVFGFLGPNGAGKSTTIGMMLGLVRPTAGSVEIFGLDAQRHRGKILRRVGAVIEAPAFYPYLGGRDNLRVVAKYSGNGEGSRIDEVLDLVGLRDRGKDKVKHYSTGMKQRLGLASVLLNEPDLVVLDEPTAGLDPAGTNEFRELIRAIATEHGKTVFMSSHLLSEVQQTCDRVAIVNKGRTLVQERMQDLLTQTGSVYFDVDEPDRAVAVLTAANVQVSRESENGTVWADVGRERIGELNSLLVGAGLSVSGAGMKRPDLESVFLEVTGNDDSMNGREN